MKLRSVVVTIAIIGFTSSVLAETMPILGPGATTCGTWTQDRKTDQYFSQLGWALGFISSYNHYMNKNIFGNADAQAIAGWIDNYCTANPLDTIYAASVELVRELGRRSIRK
jgi:hypothetical protein